MHALYDQLADRWFLSEFGAGNSLCTYVSQTPDPTGETGRSPEFARRGGVPHQDMRTVDSQHKERARA